VYGGKLIDVIKLGVIVNNVKLKILFIIYTILLILLGYLLNTLINFNHYDNYYFNLTEFEVFDDSVSGVYHHNSFFCVITQERTNENIIKTTIHELAHLLILTDEKHFLERYKEE
jgi:hypothetical protein